MERQVWHGVFAALAHDAGIATHGPGRLERAIAAPVDHPVAVPCAEIPLAAAKGHS